MPLTEFCQITSVIYKHVQNKESPENKKSLVKQGEKQK